MRSDAFFRDSSETDPFGVATEELDADLINSLRIAQLDGIDDLEAATALCELLMMEFEGYGTSGTFRVRADSEVALCVRALHKTLERLGIEFDLPWRDYSSFRSYWNRNEGYGSWQARRDMVEQFLGPVRDLLVIREEQADTALLAEPVTSHAATGWPAVDTEIRELKRRFRSARSPQDYRAVGTDCVGVLEALSRTVYDAARHLREGEEVPPIDKSKLRIGRFVDDALPGPANAEVRGLVNKAVELAHRIKHSHVAIRRDAGIAADAVVMLANMLRRIDLDQE